MHKALIGLVVVLLIIPCLGFHQVILMPSTPASDRNDHPQGRLTLHYQVHTPISIWGNGVFTNQATDEGWPGTGTNVDPYIIDGLNISDYPGDLIEIQYVDVYFIIQNCILVNGTVGVYFEQVTNGQINNNTLSRNEKGIFLRSSTNNTLTQNTLNKNDDGISLEDSANNTITQNTFNKNGLYIAGGTVKKCLQQNVDDNTVNDKPLVFWQHVIGGTVATGAGQVILINASAVTVRNQDISDATVGIQALYCDSLDLTNNILSRNSHYGLYLKGSADNIITQNTLSDNHYGINLYVTANNTVTQNILNKNDDGISLEDSANNTITQNTFNENGLHIIGGTVEKCLQQNVDDNTVNGKPLVFWQHVIGGTVPAGAGQVILINTSAVTVRNQDISDATGGIQVFFCDFLDLSDNNLSKNHYFGIKLRASANNTLTNNTLYKNSNFGIFLRDSVNNTLTDNVIINSGSYGIILYEADHNTVSKNNFIGNNPEGG
ncbi:MAG: NosD domain-containing protein, partial [Candidatus Hodarchaeota archaeon]